MKLTIGNRKTNAFHKLQEATAADGATITKRGRGFSDYDVCAALVTSGLAEWRSTGPRGGKRLHATPAGVNALHALSHQEATL